MHYYPQRPMIVQGDHTLLLETHNPDFNKARDAIAPFAELEKSPEHIHSYRIDHLSVWNAASAGFTLKKAEKALIEFSKYDVPSNVLSELQRAFSIYGKLVLLAGDDERLYLDIDDAFIAEQVGHEKSLQKFIIGRLDKRFYIAKEHRGNLKYALIKLNLPVEDKVGFQDATHLSIPLRQQTRTSQQDFALRPYQQQAVDAFSAAGGHGVIVLACGAGKTVVAMGVMHDIAMPTLIVTPNTAAAHQWRAELLDKTELQEEGIGEYTGARKEILPITIATYQMLTYRDRNTDEMPHMEVMTQHEWGLIVFDEVHVLPAPVFRAVSEIQARRRLGLTATLVREDGKEGDVFSLIGPKRYDMPWRELEEQGHIAQANCFEIRVPMSQDDHFAHSIAEKRTESYRIAAENRNKEKVVIALVEKHQGEGILVIGQYIKQLQHIAKKLGAPVITGRMKSDERERLYAAFRAGDLRLLVVSKVANYAIDLPDASVAIQISGSFGSRQEEAQRLGRILRPKKHAASFYTLVSQDSDELRFAINRQRFLAEQGYGYVIEDWEL
ncbi:MAG: helicase-associated domain-containing protein [Mariprofundaceae bacterium]|nr:helicase-associated domain-containing protein [Mariprofundaceae bacterium]